MEHYAGIDVSLERSSVCVVDETSFQLMVELNPEVGRSLAVLGRSEPIADGLVCLSQGSWTTDAIKADILQALNEQDV